MNRTSQRTEALRLAAEIAADEAQVESLTNSIGSLYAALGVINERLLNNRSRHRSLTAAFYEDYRAEAEAS